MYKNNKNNKSNLENTYNNFTKNVQKKYNPCIKPLKSSDQNNVHYYDVPKGNFFFFWMKLFFGFFILDE